MRILGLIACVAVLVGCSQSNDGASDASGGTGDGDSGAQVDSGAELGIPLPITSCAGLPRFVDPDEVLAKLPGLPCDFVGPCNFGPPLLVCSRSFGDSLICICSSLHPTSHSMTCTDYRKVARDQEAYDLEHDPASCPSPSWPHDGGTESALDSGNGIGDAIVDP